MLALLVLLAAGTITSMGYAQERTFVKARPLSYDASPDQWQDCGLRKGDVDAFVVRRPDRTRSKRKSSNIQVQYGPDVPQRARAAYDRAASIWETHIVSEVPIQIEARAIDSPSENTLGGTTPAQFWVLENEAGPQLVAGDALADALMKEDAAPDSVDMFTDFNFERDDWHFGRGPAPSGTVDFTSVALHEIAHGLHYLSLCRKTLGGGQCRFEVGGGEVAGAYTEQLRERRSDGRLTALTNEDEYPDGESVGDALTSDQLVFSGAKSEEAADRSTGPVPPKIYAPTSFENGSSLSHVDETTYPFEGRNALMTPRLAPAETNRLPGPVVCGQLADIGWSLGVDCRQYFQDVYSVRFSQQTEPTKPSATLTWEEDEEANIEKFMVEQRFFGESFEVVREDVQSPPVRLDSLGLGRFAFRVRWARSDGTTGTSIRQLEKTVPLTSLNAEVVERDDRGRGTVNLEWEVPPGTPSDVSFRIERTRGESGKFQNVGRERGRLFSASNQIPGRYSYRVASEFPQGQELVSSAVPLRVPFEGDIYVNGPFPNPTRSDAALILTARRFQNVTVEVFNSIGERVHRRERSLKRQESARLTFDSREWASGVYFLRVRGRTFSTTRKMVVVH